MSHIRYTPQRTEHLKRIVVDDRVEFVDGDTIIDLSPMVQKVTIENEVGKASRLIIRFIGWELA
jgi:uncharacterized Fe-S cluster-containing MiaB family protein